MTDRAVMLSIKPKYCELIASGKKTFELRKNKPKLQLPFKCYVYCTKNHNEKDLLEIHTDGKIKKANGKVIGEFICDKIVPVSVYYSDPDAPIANKEFPFFCLTDKEIIDYLGNGVQGWGWQISDLKIYDKPKTLEDFRKPCISPEMPYCPLCKVGYEYISETEAEFYRVDGECYTEWRCLNFIRKPPQSWCYVQEVSNND